METRLTGYRGKKIEDMSKDELIEIIDELTYMLNSEREERARQICALNSIRRTRSLGILVPLQVYLM